MKSIVGHTDTDNFFIIVETSLTSFRFDSTSETDFEESSSEQEILVKKPSIRINNDDTNMPDWLKAELDSTTIKKSTSNTRTKKGFTRAKKTENYRGDNKLMSRKNLQRKQTEEMQSLKEQVSMMSKQIENYKETDKELEIIKQELQDQKQHNQMMNELVKHLMQKSRESGTKSGNSSPVHSRASHPLRSRKHTRVGSGTSSIISENSMKNSKICVTM